MIVSVFDPLAVLLLIAANYSLHREVETKKAEPAVKSTTIADTPDIPVFITPNVAEPPQWKTTIEVPKDNIATIAPGVAATTYDYDEPFAFKPKDKK